MREAILQAENLCFTYGDGQPALDGVQLHLYPGERIAVMGPNGAGKSTLFLCLNGVLEPSAGVVRWQGQPVGRRQLNTLRAGVGIVFQDADSQIVASTVRAEVSFGPMNLGLSKAEAAARTEHAIAALGLAGFEDRPPHYLSGGEKKRVTIADIVAMESPVMVFDEPTAALDPARAVMLEDVLDTLSAQGKTLVISTHDVDFAYSWAERVILIAAGKVLADGSPHEIFRDATLLQQASLRPPMLLEVQQMLVEHGVLPDAPQGPVTVAQLRACLAESAGRH